VPPTRKPLTVQVPRSVADEIVDAAQRTHRSVAFIVRRALSAGLHAAETAEPGESAALVLTTDDDDPADTAAKIKAAAGERSLDEAIAAAWTATRARFHAWIAREEAAREAELADDLDLGLRDAAAPGTSAERLAQLARSEYPRVRALVAAHPSTPADSLAALRKDRDRTVREAATRRSS
jgi:hypothetical protein